MEFLTEKFEACRNALDNKNFDGAFSLLVRHKSINAQNKSNLVKLIKLINKYEESINKAIVHVKDHKAVSAGKELDKLDALIEKIQELTVVIAAEKTGVRVYSKLTFL